ncbi:iron-sulfur cluster assembly scaffold protein [Vibrio quintilis]|uniref:NifU-like protein n=1 Tax=Vibrio quintilis TaxID=1117707 RepID=A0A1M7YVI2_9VIBR|nr:iron-sulfur cluster assembly scaffold protein [Vibrio quintilis]SHO56622.1 NifU-like protein [Vibrio quintilis]
MFNSILVQHFSSPTHQGELADPDTTLALGNPVCGDKVNIDLKFAASGKDAQIIQARFRAWGCATSLAMANAFCSYVEGRSVDSLTELKEHAISALLGELEPSQQHCLDMLNELFQQLKSMEVA